MTTPTLLAVAHGTANPDGLAEIRRLVNIVRTKRPEVPVELAWLERATPSLAEVLGGLAGPVVVVPLLLSTGYHVKVDIRQVVGDRPATVVARQLGPDRRITQVVYERLKAGRAPLADDVVLFGAGSSDPEALDQLTVVAEHLQRALRLAEGEGVRVHARFLTDREGWRDGLPRRADVANYLLAPGFFNDLLAGHGYDDLDADFVAPPIGAHPLVAAVVCDRYDEAALDLDSDLAPGSG
jgi:sirohydrochlorin ferrochelatase